MLRWAAYRREKGAGGEYLPPCTKPGSPKKFHFCKTPFEIGVLSKMALECLQVAKTPKTQNVDEIFSPTMLQIVPRKQKKNEKKSLAKAISELGPSSK